jgi:uncharacterized protein (TIGR04255 family)
MPTLLSINDFIPFSVTCEVRYKNAYLIFDRTGHILEDLREHFTNVQTSSASPQQTAFTAEEGSFTLELGACRFTTTQIDSSGEVFAKHCKLFFGTVVYHLNISVFTRIGLRYIARKEFKSVDEAKAALASLALANLKPAKRFNSSESPTEILFRWEDKDIGAFIRLKAETAEVKITVPLELRAMVPKAERKIEGLTLDIDYYTVPPVEREQWEPEEWLRQKLRIVKKEAEGILSGGGK